MTPDDLLLSTKRDVHHRLLGDEFFANVPILLDDEGDLTRRGEVEAGPRNVRNGKTGACVVVAGVAVVQVEQTGTPTPIMTLAVEIEILEDVLINAGQDGTLRNAGVIAARLVQTLHMSHYDHRFSGLRLADTGGIRELLADEAGVRGFVMRFTASSAMFEAVDTVASVAVAVASNLATMSCATSGASIYYTLDGTYPGSGNPDARLYAAPVAVTAGQQIRVAAEKSGMNPSKNVLLYAVSAA